jgi:hypothetical protein
MGETSYNLRDHLLESFTVTAHEPFGRTVAILMVVEWWLWKRLNYNNLADKRKL